MYSWVQTEMGNAGARAFGLENAPDTLEASISGLVKVVSKPKADVTRCRDKD